MNLQLLFPYPLNFLPYVLCLSLSASSLHPSSSWIDRLLPVFSRVTAQFRDHGVHVTNHLYVCVCVGVFARIVKGLRGHRGLWYQQSYQSLWSLNDWCTDWLYKTFEREWWEGERERKGGCMWYFVDFLSSWLDMFDQHANCNNVVNSLCY